MSDEQQAGSDSKMGETRTDLWNPARIFGRILFSPTLAQRSLAMLIDLALVSLAQVWLSQVFGVYQPFVTSADNALINGDGLYFYVGQTTTLPYLWLAVSIVVYFTFFETLFGATLGKAALRLQVALLDGGRPAFGAVLMRNILRLVDALPLLYIVGLLVAQSTIHEQRIGDIVARTTVVPRPARKSDVTPIPRLRLKLLVTALALVALIGGGILFQYFGRAPLIIQSWANANNSYQSGTSAASAKAPVCGPTPAWPDPPPITNAPATANTTRRPILQYALGDPQWANGALTYPIRVEVWDDTTDSGQLPIIPHEISMSDLGVGPDVFNGHVILGDFNPLNGGWQITGGDMSCARAG